MIPGQVVFVKKGRDKGRAMVVVSVDGEYVYLVDGKLRLLEKPKKKKAKHIQPTKNIASLVLACGRTLQNTDIRKSLDAYRDKEVGRIVKG